MIRFKAAAAAFIFILMLAACTSVLTPSDPTPTPTQSLSLAENYVSGLSEVPAGKFLLILAKTETSGTGSCDFPVVEQSPLIFWPSSGILKISSDGSLGWLSDDNLIDVKGHEIQGLGFFGYVQANDYSIGGGIHDEIYYIDHLPFSVPSMSLIIHSVLKDGTIIAAVEEDIYRFEPGESWTRVSTSNYEANPDCVLMSRLSITNYGLWDSENVIFVDDPILP